MDESGVRRTKGGVGMARVTDVEVQSLSGNPLAVLFGGGEVALEP